MRHTKAVQTPTSTGYSVANGADRREATRQVFGNLTVVFKVLSEDTHGALFVIENVSQGPGGPPRHIHHDQDEWFYAVEGEFVVEVGGIVHRLEPGASVFAPRQIVHAWAHIGRGTGRLVIVFQPAGVMESFFDEFAGLDATPAPDVMRDLFQSHGMEVVGPPLSISSIGPRE